MLAREGTDCQYQEYDSKRRKHSNNILGSPVRICHGIIGILPIKQSLSLTEHL